MNRIMSYSRYAAYLPNGELLCYGNPNEGLSYHLSWIDFDIDNVVLCWSAVEVKNHVRKFVNESKLSFKGCKILKIKDFKIKEINFYWE